MSDQNRQLVLSTPKELSDYLNRSKSAIALALPNHLKPDRMLRLALTAFSTTPKLRECTAQSILASIVVASQIGLEPGVAGQGYLIPYGKVCTFVPGWQGLVGLLNNSGRATAWTGAVFDGDEWEFQLGSNPKCVHVPGPNYGDPTKMRWVYACGQVNGSQMPVVEAWPIARVWKHRDKFNKVGARHYSFEHPEMYARKVVLLQVLKYMPRSIELNNAMTAANAAEMNRTTRVEDGTVIDVETVEIPNGKVGALAEGDPSERSETTGATPTEAAASEGEKKTETPPQEEQKQPPGPTAADLRKGILAKLATAGVGKVGLVKHLIAAKRLPEGAKFDGLDRDALVGIDESIDDDLSAIKTQ